MEKLARPVRSGEQNPLTESWPTGRIAAGEGRFNTNTEVVINTEVKSIPVTKKGVYFAFRDQGACISILAIKVYYISCPEISVNFAHFPATPTGREVALIEQTIGTCVANAVVIEQPTFLCKGDGKWYLPSGGCHCKPGYQADVEKQECTECPIGKFKHEAGSHSCEACPAHSKSSDYGFTECRCDPGYFRAEKDPKKMPCTREFSLLLRLLLLLDPFRPVSIGSLSFPSNAEPPSAPQNLTVNFVDQSTVFLSWNAPHMLGGRTDTTYRVVCDACSMGVKYIPNTVRLFLIFLHVERKFNAPPFTSLYFLSPLLRTGGFQRHENHDNWIERGHHLSIPSVRRERCLGVGRKVGIRGHHRDHGCQRAKFGEQREDYEREEFRIEHKLGRADNRNRRGQRSGGKIRRSGRIRNYSVIYQFLSFDRPMDMEFFAVRCYPRYDDATNATVIQTSELSATFKGLKPSTDYAIQVRAKTTRGWGEYTPVVYKKTPHAMGLGR